MGDRDQLAVHLGRLERLGPVEQRLAGILGAEPADLLALLEVVAAVAPEHVGEVVHQRVVLLGLMARVVGHVVARVVAEPLGHRVVLLPRPVAARRRIEAESSCMRPLCFSSRSLR